MNIVIGVCLSYTEDGLSRPSLANFAVGNFLTKWLLFGSRMHLSRTIVQAVVIDTHHSDTQNSFPAKEREARSSGGFTLKEGGAKRPRG